MVKRTGNIFTFLVLIAVVIGIARYFYTAHELKTFGTSTQGIIDTVRTQHKKAKEFTFYYFVNKKIYRGRSHYQSPWTPEVGDTIEIRYSLKDPSVYQVTQPHRTK